MTDLTSDVRARCASFAAPTATPWGSSRFAAFRACPRKHQLRYHRHVRTVADAGYYSLGRLVHAVLAYCAAGHDWREMIAFASDTEGDLGIVYEAERLCGAYFSHYGTESCGFPGASVIGIEQALESTIGGMPYSSRADLLLRLVGETVVVVDHKTRSSKVPDDRDEYIRELATRPQLLGLSALVQELFSLATPPPVLLNEIVKTKIPKFGRTMVRFTQHQINGWRLEHACCAEGMMALGDGCGVCNLDQCAPVIPSGSRCEYFDFCHGNEAQRIAHYRQDRAA